MNLTLSLAIDGGAAAATAAAKKRKVVDGDRMVKKVERFDRGEDGEVMEAATSDAGGGGGMEMVHFLLSAVAAGEAGDADAAASALREVYRHASRRGGGEPGQRVAAIYADALASRSPAATAATRADRFMAYTMFYQASPFYQFAHFTANQAIIEAFDSAAAAAAGRRPRRHLHVVDLDVSYGFQWPSLIQSLSDAADTPAPAPVTTSLRITGFGTDADELHETEARLTRFAAGFPNLQFEFDAILTTESSNIDRVKADDGATVVVNLVFPAAATSSLSSQTVNTIIRSLDPSMVFLIEKHDEGGGEILPHFAVGVRYYAAVFESLHECLPAESGERVAIERNHLGREIADAVDSLRRHGHGGGGGWKEAMGRAGLEGARLSSRTVSQAKLLLKMKSGGGGGGGFHVVEGGGGMAMSLAWRDMALATATVWRRRRQ
uniref:Uncharacterized protein n=1 Tax=Leersia perrieri TaxID=77586 RepID=A0A0D9W526_9ORYZ